MGLISRVSSRTYRTTKNMASIVKFTPITGVQEAHGAHCYILQLDDFKFLLDCGWDTTSKSNQQSIINKLTKYAPDIDCVLLSHPDIRNLGSLPLLYKILQDKYKKDGLNKPFPHIYGSKPLKHLGQMTMYDYFLNVHSSLDTEKELGYTLDDIDEVFDSIQEVENMRPIHLVSSGNDADENNNNNPLFDNEDGDPNAMIDNATGAIKKSSLRASGYGSLRIEASTCGHMIGGMSWRIIKDEEQHIIYNISYNLKKERHLMPYNIPDSIQKPEFMITDCGSKDLGKVPGHVTSKDFIESATTNIRYRNEALVHKIYNKLKLGGNVLIPCDQAGRVLEITAFLESIWQNEKSQMSKYFLGILSHQGKTVYQSVLKMSEWLRNDQNNKVNRDNSTLDSYFDFRYAKILTSLEALEDI